jgi:hypothetical protein
MHAAVLAAAALVVSLAATAPAAAQDRPSEEELFGAPADAAPAPSAPAAEPKGEPGKGEQGRNAPEKTERPEEAQLFGAPPAAQAAPPPPQRLGGERDREDTLAIGGQLYLRAQTVFQEETSLGDGALSSPNLLDLYLDARPNDRVRAFALARLSWDPTKPAEPTTLGELPLTPTATLARQTNEPSAVLDQLWINFDIGRRAFLTAGRQHTKWGVGRFWNPTDYLHPVRRDPLAVFDVRTGTTMVKLHVPWEARGWNAYAVAVLEDVAGDAPVGDEGTSRLGRVGVGGRAEIVLGPMELGLDALAQDGHRPRFGVDVSAGVWDVDLYAEAAIRTSVDTPRWCATGAASPSPFDQYVRCDPVGPTAQLVVGGDYSVKYSDEDVITFGAEYFYDRSGYEDASIYPALLGVATLGGAPPSFDVEALGTTRTISNEWTGQPNPFTPFYLGRHYAGAFVSLPGPGRWDDTTFTLSVLGNLSDESFVARLDHSVLALTYLRVESFVALHLGARDGEFRLGFQLPPGAELFGLPPSIQPTVFEAGIALRLSL